MNNNESSMRKKNNNTGSQLQIYKSFWDKDNRNKKNNNVRWLNWNMNVIVNDDAKMVSNFQGSFEFIKNVHPQKLRSKNYLHTSIFMKNHNITGTTHTFQKWEFNNSNDKNLDSNTNWNKTKLKK